MDRKRRLAVCAGTLILLAGGAHATGIYQWKDAQGRVHFGDAPQSGDATDVSADYDYRLPFEIVFEGIDYRVPPQLRDRLSSSISKIFTIYKQALGLQYPQGNEFRIRIYGDQQAYRAYQRRQAPVLENAAGFYNAHTNQITTWGMNEDALQRLVTHESSHAISASGDNRIPVWLNEGLAVYFENMDVSGLGARVPLVEHWLAVLQRRAPGSASQLRGLLDSPHQQWYAANGPDNLSYAASWSVVYFLMGSEQGRALMRTLLHAPGSAVAGDSSVIIDSAWPTGFDGFYADWQHWLQTTTQGAHRY